MFDYVSGKADWLARGLPSEGKLANEARIGLFADRGTLTCGLATGTIEVANRMREEDRESCIVLNDERVVLGRLRLKDVQDRPDSAAEQVMEPGPSTFRPNVSLQEMIEYMRKHRLEDIVITTAEGILCGTLSRRDAEQAATGLPARATPPAD